MESKAGDFYFRDSAKNHKFNFGKAQPNSWENTLQGINTIFSKRGNH